jgi:putative ABC transport system permease protein
MTLLIALLRRAYAALLLLLPGDVRRKHGAEMRETSRQIVEDTLRTRGVTAAVAAALRECMDVLAAAARASRRAPGEIRQDLAYAWRLMWARPGFTAVVIATLAIGIGATTTVFTVVNAVLLRPLPYAEPDRLVLLAALSQRGVQVSFSPRDFIDMTAAMPSVAGAAAFTDQQLTLTGGAEAERVPAAVVTWNFFDVLGAPPRFGRGFARHEGEAAHQRVAVIGHGLWQRRFGGDQGAVGREITFDGQRYTIVGIATPAMSFPGGAEVWRPLVFTDHHLDPSQRGARWVSVVARLKRGIAVQQANAEVRAIAARIAADYPRTHRGRSAAVRPLQDHLVRDTKTGLLALFGAVALVLLIACANVANLLLARSSARASEMTVRMALGASRGRLLRQCLAENLLLTGMASAAGLALAVWGTTAATAALPAALPRAEEIAVDWRVAAFASATAVALAVVLGSIAALGLRGQQAPTTARATPAGARLVRRSLVVAEVAMALVLLTGAGLFVKSLTRLYQVEPGFDPSNVLTFSVTMPPASYPTPEQLVAFTERLRRELAARPGVEAAAGIFGLPLTDEFSAASSFERIGIPTDPDHEPVAAMRIVTPDYFRALRIAFRAGRDFSDRDTAAAPGVAIVNETAVRKYWAGQNPIGQSLRLHAGVSDVAQTPRTVIGVIRDVRYGGLDVEPQAEVYIPHAQHPVDGLVVTLRTSGAPRPALEHVRAILRRLDPDIPVSQVATMEEIVAESVAARRFSLVLLAGFAGVALLLAAIGIYGVLAYTVGQRTREIGLRMAMGAPRAHVLRLVVGEGVGLVVAGLAIGVGFTLGLTRMIRGLLFEVQPYDPSTLAAVGAALVVVALTASYLPARRAASVDPVTALRAE